MSKKDEEVKAGKARAQALANEPDLDQGDEVVDGDDGDNIHSPTSKPAGNTNRKETIEIDRNQLDSILTQLEEQSVLIGQLQSNAVSTQGHMPTMVRNKKKDTMIKLRKWDDKYVVGWINKGKANKPLFVVNEYNPQTRETVQFIEILLHGVAEPLRLEYLQYLRDAEPVFVKLLAKIVEEEEVIEQGMVYKKDFVENGYGMFETTVRVPVEIVIPHYSYKLLLEDGEELVISDRFVG